MSFELLDSLSLPGNPQKANEDSFGHILTAAVVMDGATGLGEQLLPGKSDAAWVSQFGARRLLAHLTEGATAQGALKGALEDTERSFNGLRRRPPVETWEIPFASMMFVAQSAGGFDALWFGDCAALLKRGGEPTIVIGEAFDRRAQESARVRKLAARQGISPAAGINRDEFLPALRKARNYVNTMEGAWLFGPDARAAGHAALKRVHAPLGSIVLLASDGFLALASDYGCYDADSLVRAAQEKGLKTLGEELRAVEEADPAGEKFPRFKKHDDATAVLLRTG